MEGFFIALITVGVKEAKGVEENYSTFSDHVKYLLETSSGMNGSQWLMINITYEKILEDVKTLIKIKRKINAKTTK